MRECDLNVQREGGKVRNKNEDDSHVPARDAGQDKTIPKPVPITTHKHNLCCARPPSFAQGGGILAQQVYP